MPAPHSEIRQSNHPTGYTLIFAVVIVGAISLTASISLSFLGRSNLQDTNRFSLSKQANMSAHTCAELALLALAEDTNTTGSQTTSTPFGDCTYTITSTGGNSADIEAEATSENMTRRVFVSLDTLNPSLNVVNWQEVVGF